MKFYGYKGCGTCRRAIKFLEEHNVAYDFIPIREQPPSMDELRQMLTRYPLKKLFNTSGQDYRKLNIKEKLPSLTESQALQLLHNNGNLIKRPFVIGKNIFLIGFNEELWDTTFS